MVLNASGDPAFFPPSRYVLGGFGGTQGAIGASIVQFPIEKLKAKKIAYVTRTTGPTPLRLTGAVGSPVTPVATV